MLNRFAEGKTGEADSLQYGLSINWKAKVRPLALCQKQFIAEAQAFGGFVIMIRYSWNQATIQDHG